MAIKDLDNRFRIDYEKGTLNKKDCLTCPFMQFEKWFNDIIALNIDQPNAMVVSTVSNNGQPSSRVVLLKSFDQTGFVFFTDYRSKKSKEILNNSKAALLFYNQELERQIRIEGKINKIDYTESNNYFKSRPKESQLAAISSHQSTPLKNRNELDTKHKKNIEKYKNVEIECPEFWGGFQLVPSYFEFWQGRKSRLHDRIIYKEINGQPWSIKRISP